MLTGAPETGATEEVVDNTADLEVVENSTEQELPAEVDLDNLSDEDFTAYLNSQLDGTDAQDSTEDTETQTSLDDSAEVTETDIAAEDEEVEETDTEQQVGYSFNIAGQDITVTDEADIKRLIERGLQSAVDAKATLPAQQLAAMLANNKLDDPKQLSQLIDMANGDQAALKAFLKSKGIDPYDLASADDEEVEYKPKDHTVKPETLELNRVLDSLQDSEHFPTTADIVMDQWDEASRQLFMKNPKNFTVLNNQVADGTYAAIAKEMAKLEIMGTLPAGDTQFEIYRIVGDRMYANNLLPGQTSEVTESAKPAEVEQQQTAEQRLQAAAKQQRKRAVAPNRSIPKTQTTTQMGPTDAFSGTDEDFLKATQHLFNSM